MSHDSLEILHSIQISPSTIKGGL